MYKQVWMLNLQNALHRGRQVCLLWTLTRMRFAPNLLPNTLGFIYFISPLEGHGRTFLYCFIIYIFPLFSLTFYLIMTWSNVEKSCFFESFFLEILKFFMHFKTPQHWIMPWNAILVCKIFFTTVHSSILKGFPAFWVMFRPYKWPS